MYVCMYVDKSVMYQSNRSFNIPHPPPPPWATPRALEFLENFVQIPPSPGRKLFKCLHPRENYQITVLTFQTPLHATSHLFKENEI